MNYTIKSGDSLTEIANKFKVPVLGILAINPQISDPNRIFPGDLLRIPNMQDVPKDAEFEIPTKPSQLVLRARSVVGCDIKYKLGSGGRFPKHEFPSRDKFCDCSGFVCWVLGLDRKTNIPYYKQFGGWIFTDSMEADIKSSAGIFEKLNRPEPGCIVVYGAGPKAIGHVAIVTEVVNGTMDKVIHCSSGNSKKTKSSIQETDPYDFKRPDILWGRFAG